MAMTEDAASVLEDFVQNVANLPAEIQHLLEEIQAKDKIMQECRSDVAGRDQQIQRFIKANNGCTQPFPKDEAFCAAARGQFEQAQAIQEEKVALSVRAATLLDKQIKRLDVKIKDLQNEGSIQPDPQLPTLLATTAHQPRIQRVPVPNMTGIAQMTSMPSLTGTQANKATAPPPAPSAPQVAAGTASSGMTNAPIQRIVQPASHRQPSPLATSVISHATSVAIPSANPPQLPPPGAPRTLVRSPSADTHKRRRLQTGHLNAPATSSALRQSSLGPAPSRTGLDGSSRGSSAGPQRPSKKNASSLRSSQGTASPASGSQTQRAGHLSTNSNGNNAKSSKKLGNAARRARAARQKSGTPVSSITNGGNREDSASRTAGSDDGVDSEDIDMIDADSRGDGSAPTKLPQLSEAEEDDDDDDDDMSVVSDEEAATAEGEVGVAEGEEGEGDDKKYCTCHSVSYGNMVACDNDDCPHEWFHWSCVGVTSEPKGKWFCPECRPRR